MRRETRKKITIDPVTRLNGYGKITIFLNGHGRVENTYFQTKGFRGFERFCQGQPAEEMPRITSRICGLCSWAHHTASLKALDDLWGIQPTPTTEKLRRLTQSIAHVSSKLFDFYYLTLPDFIEPIHVGVEGRGIIALMKRLGRETGGDVAEKLFYSSRILELVGGKPIHPVSGLPGRFSKTLTEKERVWAEEKLRSIKDLAIFSLDLFEEIVLKNHKHFDLILDEDLYSLKTCYMGIVDRKEQLDLYDGWIKVIGSGGEEILRFRDKDYLKHIEEHRENWTWASFPHLRKTGWTGFSFAGDDSLGVYRTGSLARLNTARCMKTPQAQEAYERMFEVMPKPCHHTLAFHWADLIEMIYSAEISLQLIRDPEITGKDTSSTPRKTSKEGIGIVESPSGTLIHHYRTDNKALITDVDIITGSNHNNAAICMSIRQAAEKQIKGDHVGKDILNRIEMACRAYSPCIPCMNH